MPYSRRAVVITRMTWAQIRLETVGIILGEGGKLGCGRSGGGVGNRWYLSHQQVLKHILTLSSILLGSPKNGELTLCVQ